MKNLYSFFDKPKTQLDVNAIRISLASPEKIREWSYGEVKKPETINYRTFKPERDGLFCAKIFGPIKDFECICGKYKRMKHHGIICEKCGVEVIQSKVRRERLGHISLATPIAHIWFLKSLPSRIAVTLDLPIKEVERVLYCEAYIVTEPGNTDLAQKQVLSEDEYKEAVERFGDESFAADMGGEVILKLLKEVDVEKDSEQLREELKQTSSEAKRKKISRRLKIIEAFKESGNRPEWMMLTVIPVLPPDLRPLVPLDGGRFATSDLNDLYRRVINRNNRLKRLLELNAPDIIIRNERRMLQEAVDALFDNGRRGKAITGPNKRPLKSLSDMLRGKQGRFRQNLLGKRVDYSGRTVIVVGPELKLHQCGLPKIMALELFKPFIFQKLEEKGFVNTIKSAKKMVEKERPEVWDILEEVTKEHPVLLNRAPTLHRLGIQAFEPVLIEGKAIQLHPLVCVAFNADFDGDQMAVHVPLSIEAQMEARVLMMSTNNILSPAHGKPIINPTQDIVLGIYYMTLKRPFVTGSYDEKTGTGIYCNPDEVRRAYDAGEVDLHAEIMCRMEGKRVLTTVGRVLLREIIPLELPFNLINKVMKKGELSSLIDEAYRRCGGKTTVIMADRIRTLGFDFATKAGISICIDDIVIPQEKVKLLDQARKKVDAILTLHQNGEISEDERRNMVVDEWAETTEEIKKCMLDAIQYEEVKDPKSKKPRRVRSLNPLWMMVDSGARGSKEQIKQLAGMRGLMAKPSNEIIETPITANFREGLSVLEYFISTHGARKGLADTALKTANSGYLTRKLVDVSQDCIVSTQDCGTTVGVTYRKLIDESGREQIPISERILGRVALNDIADPITQEVIVKGGEIIDEVSAERIADQGMEEVEIRSVLTCQAQHGICARCYGRDLARGHIVNIGEATGIIAAQSIGEPGTQLTMRTFHIGGIAGHQESVSGLTANEEGEVRFERVELVEKQSGDLVVMNRNGEIIVREDDGHEHSYSLVLGAILHVREGERVLKGQQLAEWEPYYQPILANASGVVSEEGIEEEVTYTVRTEETGRQSRVIIESRDPNIRPQFVITDQKGRTLAVDGLESRFYMPNGAVLTMAAGQKVSPGDILAKLPREISKARDITGGLPRVTELFEARKPKDPAIISEIDGKIEFGKDLKGKRRIIVRPEVGDAKEYLIPKGKHIIVKHGEEIRAGEPLMDGPQNPQDILKVRGEIELAHYLLDEIQTVYRNQGIRINDKHIEIIVRQMLRRVKIKDPGDTRFLVDEQVEKWGYEMENLKAEGDEKQPAVAEPLLLGITKASLANESFLAASSFQETTKILTEASLNAKLDDLRGLKENLIMGRLIPAGTGFPTYRKVKPTSEEMDEDGSLGFMSPSATLPPADTA
jgi:DNA-directed RNA polymerase subunit beta'